MVQPSTKRLVTEAALPELVRDAIAAALIAGSGVTITPDDVGDTITISIVGGLDTEAVQDAVAAMLVEGSGLGAVYDDGAGTYTISTSGLAPASHTHATTDIINLTEYIQDAVGAFLVDGTNFDVTYNDASNTFSVVVTGTTAIPVMSRTAAYEAANPTLPDVTPGSSGALVAILP